MPPPQRKHGFFEDPFDFEFLPANPVRLVPVNFCHVYRTIGKFYVRESFSLRLGSLP